MIDINKLRKMTKDTAAKRLKKLAEMVSPVCRLLNDMMIASAEKGLYELSILFNGHTVIYGEYLMPPTPYWSEGDNSVSNAWLLEQIFKEDELADMVCGQFVQAGYKVIKPTSFLTETKQLRISWEEEND